MIQPQLNRLWNSGPLIQEDIDILDSINPEYKETILEIYPELKEMYPKKYGDA